jgi:DMSO reductase anchor subunit
MGVYGLGLVFFEIAWQPLGWLGAIGALATVFTTAMIYTQMKTIPRWQHWTTPILFLGLALAGGALLSGRITIALVLLILAAIAQIMSWYAGDKSFTKSGTTLETATGLGRIGKARAFEPPHTGTNYLLREFAYEIGRKHASNLRIIGMGLAFALPILMLLTPIGHVGAAVAVLSHIIGVLALRWLFFAQAEHVVGLFYGKR